MCLFVCVFVRFCLIRLCDVLCVVVLRRVVLCCVAVRRVALWCAVLCACCMCCVVV